LEQREEKKSDSNETLTFVPPQDAIHPYLLFRGCDIKDLHVHESVYTTKPPTDPAILNTAVPINENHKSHKKYLNGFSNNDHETLIMKDQRNHTNKKDVSADDKTNKSQISIGSKVLKLKL